MMTHNYKNRLYRIYNGMKQRCYNPNHINYNIYGKLGIHIYDDWLKSFDTFATWAINNGYTDELTIDRIDPTKDYCPSNCRWVTASENSRNTRRWKDGWHIDCKPPNYIYPVIFHRADEGGFYVSFPDYPECITEGDNMEQAYEMAVDALGLSITSRLESNAPLPLPSRPDTIQTEKGNFITVIEFDMKAYKKRTNQKPSKNIKYSWLVK